uniref:C2 domain-containing protein n=1 Tax=Hanusia phi TaxID=3032 RepID=A0A7S0HWV0_9CRYP
MSASSHCSQNLLDRLASLEHVNRVASMNSESLLSCLSEALQVCEQAIEDLERLLAVLGAQQQRYVELKDISMQLDSSVCGFSGCVSDMEAMVTLTESAWRDVKGSMSVKLKMMLSDLRVCETISLDASDPTEMEQLLQRIDELTCAKSKAEENLKLRSSEVFELRREIEALSASKIRASEQGTSATRSAVHSSDSKEELQALQLKLSKLDQDNQELSRLLVDFDSEQIAMKDFLEQQTNTFKSFVLCLVEYLSPGNSCTREDMQQHLADMLKFVDFSQGSDPTSADALQGSILALADLHPRHDQTEASQLKRELRDVAAALDHAVALHQEWLSSQACLLCESLTGDQGTSINADTTLLNTPDKDKPWQVVGELVSVSSAFKPPKELMTPPTPKSGNVDESRRSSLRPVQILSPPPSSPDHLDSSRGEEPKRSQDSEVAAPTDSPKLSAKSPWTPTTGRRGKLPPLRVTAVSAVNLRAHADQVYCRMRLNRETWHTALTPADRDPEWDESHVFQPDRVTRDLHVAILTGQHDLLGHVSVSLWDAGLQGMWDEGARARKALEVMSVDGASVKGVGGRPVLLHLDFSLDEEAK